MEKSARTFLAIFTALIILFVFSPNPIVMAGGGGGSGGGGGGYSSGITLQQREQIETQLWNRISEIQISAWNQDASYFAACAPGSSGCSSAINNPEPGAYSVWVSARVYDYDTATDIYPFSGNNQTVVRAGENFTSVKVSLREWQFVKIALPETVSSDEIRPRIEYQYNGYANDSGVGITDDGQIAWTHVPLSGTNFSLSINGKSYPIPAEKIFGAIANSEPVVLVQLYVSVERLERYVRVPSEFPSIQAAVNFVPGGSTILIEPGVYEESISIDLPDKGEITLLGSPTYPRDVVIRSSAPQTLWIEGGAAKINLIGLSVQNDFPGRSSGAKWWSDAAVTFDLGIIATLDHVVLESTGSGNVIAANYSTLKMTNTTLVGNYSNTGIVMFNNVADDDPADELWQNSFQYLIFYALGKAADIERGAARVYNSIYYQTKASDTYFSETNMWGDPEFLGAYDWNRYLPSSESVVIREVIKRGDGNYPGALMPMRPNQDDRG